MPKSPSKQKRTSARSERWSDQHRLLCHLLEEEVHGLSHYLRSLHYLAIFLIAVSAIALIISVQSIFENGQHGLTGFVVACVACIIAIIFALLSLKPWVLPRFLLPMDIRQLRYDEMISVIASPREYIHLLKHHIQKLTDAYLLPKLRHLRFSIFILVFGLAVALVLCLALP